MSAERIVRKAWDDSLKIEKSQKKIREHGGIS